MATPFAEPLRQVVEWARAQCIDIPYMRKWCGELGVNDLLDRIANVGGRLID